MPRPRWDGCKVASGGDAAADEGALNLVAVRLLWQPHDVDEPADGALRKGERRELQAGDSPEQRIVALGGGLAQLEYLADAA
jgi:hypothetical protein